MPKKGGEIGKIRLADGGTLFLDEIGEMDFYLQAKILHVLQEDSFYPVGSSRPVKADVRLITATNKNLEEEVKKGRFREDLYYRLNVVSITLPPLCQRKNDIRELVDYMLPQIEEKVGRKGIVIAPEVYEDFHHYEWPGNIRELENVLERAVNMVEGKVIGRAALPQSIRNARGTVTDFYGKGDYNGLKSYLAAAEKAFIIKALQVTNYNKTEAIKRLGIGRTAFYKKVHEYQISLQTSVH